MLWHKSGVVTEFESGGYFYDCARKCKVIRSGGMGATPIKRDPKPPPPYYCMKFWR